MRASVQAFLDNNPVLRAASVQTRDRLAGVSIVRVLKAQQILFQHGDPAEAFYMILSGRLSICLQTLDGRQLALNLVSAGSFLGEIAVLDGGIRSASAITLSDCKIAVVRRQDFLQAVWADQALVESLVLRLCSELRRLSERVADAGFLDVQAGLAQRLLESLAARPGETREPQVAAISQETLAQSVGISRITANKYLNAWRKRGWVSLSRSKITLIDATSLVNLIEAQIGGARLDTF